MLGDDDDDDDGDEQEGGCRLDGWIGDVVKERRGGLDGQMTPVCLSACREAG